MQFQKYNFHSARIYIISPLKRRKTRLMASNFTALCISPFECIWLIDGSIYFLVKTSFGRSVHFAEKFILFFPKMLAAESNESRNTPKLCQFSVQVRIECNCHFRFASTSFPNTQTSGKITNHSSGLSNAVKQRLPNPSGQC